MQNYNTFIITGHNILGKTVMLYGDRAITMLITRAVAKAKAIGMQLLL